MEGLSKAKKKRLKKAAKSMTANAVDEAGEEIEAQGNGSEGSLAEVRNEESQAVLAATDVSNAREPMEPPLQPVDPSSLSEYQRELRWCIGQVELGLTRPGLDSDQSFHPPP